MPGFNRIKRITITYGPEDFGERFAFIFEDEAAHYRFQHTIESMIALLHPQYELVIVIDPSRNNYEEGGLTGYDVTVEDFGMEREARRKMEQEIWWDIQSYLATIAEDDEV